jgi:tetratricopeptide (TPR) repeat protein
LRSFERALAAEAFADSPVGFAYVSLHLGYALSLAGRANEGIPILEKSIHLAESRGFVARHSLRLAYVSEAYLTLGRKADALNAVTRALELARSHGERANEAYSLRMTGEIHLHGGNLSDAKTWLTKSLALSEELGMRPLEANCHNGLANVFDLAQQKSEAERHRRISSSLVDEMEMRLWR